MTLFDEPGPVEQRTGDILKAQTQVIVNPVNTHAVMGKGLALTFKNHFGAAYFQAYQRDCAIGRLRIGRPTIYQASTPWVLNFATKDTPGQPSKIEYIERGLKYFAANYRQAGIISIAFPRLGTGEGKLPWAVVEPVMLRLLSQVAREGCAVYIYRYQGQPDQRTIPPEVQQLLQEHRESGLAYHPEQPCQQCGCPLSYVLALYPDCRVCCRCLPGSRRYGHETQERILTLFKRREVW